MTCKRCSELPLRPSPQHANDRKCAFSTGNKFVQDNYCCDTLLRIRHLAESLEGRHGVTIAQHEDHNLITVPIPDHEMVLWVTLLVYKSRGRTTQAWSVDFLGGFPTLLTVQIAQDALEHLEALKLKGN